MRLAKERKELRIVADQIGAPTSARVIAQAVADILSPSSRNLVGRLAGSGGVVNVVCAGETNWHAFATAIAAGLKSRGVKLEGEVVERRGAYGTGPSLYLRDPDGYLIELKPR